MDPTAKRRYIGVLAWIAALTLLAASLCLGTAYGRVRNWTSAEMVYTPPSTPLYESDCLVAGGQTIQLSDWDAQTVEKTVILAKKVPAASVMTIQTSSEVSTTVTDETSAESTTVATTQEVPTTSATTTVTDAAVPALADAEPTTTSSATETTALSTTSTASTTATQEVTTTQAETTTTVSAAEVTTTTVGITETTETSVTSTTAATTTAGHTVDGVAVTMDEVAATYLSYAVQEDDTSVKLILSRRAAAPALEQVVQVTIHLAWQGREGTLSFRLLPPTPVIDDRVLQATRLPYLMEFSSAFGELEPAIARVEQLTETAEGALTYQETSALIAELTENGVRISCATEQTLPPSGSYRLVIQWRWNSYTLSQQEICFFVNTN